MARHVLAIDLGTSALKVALVSTAGEVIASEQEECRVEILPGGGAEQDPADWWAQVTRASSRLMARGVAAPESVAAVSCTAQWSGTVPVDDHGDPVRNAIIWMDSRGAPYAQRVTGGLVEVQGYGVGKLARWIRKSAGIPARSGKDPIAHILWLKHAEPEAYRRAHLFLEPKDWLNLRLTGRAAASYDSIALHWVTDNRSPDRIRCDPGLLRLAGLDRAQLPGLLAATDVLGPLSPGSASALGVAAGIPVVVGAPGVWCQIFADVFGRTVEQVADPVNANARGAAMLAAVALGELTFAEVPDRVQVEQTYRPAPGTRKLYDERFAEFVGLYRRNRKAHARLNRDRG